MFKQKSKTPTTIKRALQLTILVIVVAASFVVTFGRSDSASAATSSTINFQARLLTAAGSVVPDGQYNVEFKLYNASSSSGSSQGSCTGDSACVWTETRTSTDKVRVVNGYLTVNLGSVTPFASTINWDQELWLSMNIGGATVSPGWDGEMNPRLKLTAVPYAFTAGKLVGGTGANTTTLDTGTPSGNNTIHLPAESGTLCIQSSVNCGFALSSGGSSYIQNQFAAAQSSSSFWISGTGRAATALQAPLLDAATSGALAIGTTNATAINLNQNVTLASGKTLSVQGIATFQPAADGTAIFNIKTSTGNNLFTVDSTNTRVGIGLGGSTNPTLNGAGLEIKGALRLSGGSAQSDRYITPVGSSVPTAINVANYDPGSYGQIIAMGIPSSAQSTSRVLSLLDARTVAHQPTISVFSPSENDVFGLSWDGSSSDSYLKSTASGTIYLQPASTNALGVTSTAVNLYQNTTVSANKSLTVQGNALFKPATNATSAFMIQNSDASQTVLNVDTSNGRVGVGGVASYSKFEVLGGDAAIYNNGGNPRLVLGNSTAAGQNGYLQWDSTNNYFRIESVGTNGLKINDNYVTIGNIYPDQPLKVANGTNLMFQVNTTGSVLSKTTSDSSTAFQIQNTASEQILNLDTTANASNLVTNASFETDTSGWAARTGCTLTRVTSASLFGAASGRCVNTATTGAGLNYNKTLSATTNYTLSFYAKASATMSTLDFGYAPDGSTESTFVSTGNSVTSGGWTRFSYNFTTAAISGTPYVFIKQSDATARNVYIDGVQLEANGSASAYGDARITLNSSVNSSLTVQPAADSTTTFAVYTQGGNQAFNVNTLTNRVGIGIMNAGARLHVLGNSSTVVVLAARGASGQTADLFQLQDNSGSVVSSFNASGQYVAGRTGASGLQGSILFADGASANTATLQVAGTLSGNVIYQLPVASGTYAICTTAAVCSGYAPASGSSNYIQNTTTQQTANFNIVSVATGSIASQIQGAASSTVAVAVIKGGATPGANADVLQLQDSSSNVLFKLQNAGAAVFQNSTDTDTAFLVNNAAGTSVLRVDAQNQRVAIGLSSGTIPAKLYVTTGSNVVIRAKQTGSSDVLQLANGTADLFTVGSAGAVLSKTTTNATTAFQVQNSSGNAVLNVDTSNGRVGVGTNAPTRALDVAINNTGTASLPLVLRQAGTGDTGLELQTTSQNFYMGIDATDSKLKISSAASANGTTTQGNTSQGAGNDFNSNGVQAAKLVASATGNVSSMSVYITAVDATPANRMIQVGVYSDNGSGTSPSTLLGSSTAQTAVVGWNTISFSGVSMTSGTTYWLAMAENGANHYALASGSGTTAYHLTSGYLMPSSFAANSGNSTDNPSFYATLALAGSSDNFGGTNLFALGDTGQAVFQNSANSTSAFKIQNASSSSIFSVDTTNARVGINNSSPTSALTINAPTTAVTDGELVVASSNANVGIVIETGASPSNNSFQVRNSSGTVLAGISGTGRLFTGGTNAFANTQMTVDISAASYVGTVIQGAASQTADLLQLQDSSGNVNGSINSTGTQLTLGRSGTTVDAKAIILTGSTQTADAFEIQSSAASPIAGIRPNGTIWSAPVSNPVTDVPSTARLFIQANSASSNSAVLRASASGTGVSSDGAVLRVQNKDGTKDGFTVNGDASVTSKNFVDSTTAFQIQNATGTSILGVDTTNGRVGIQRTAPAVALDVSGAIQQTGVITTSSGASYANQWTKLGSCTLTAQYQECMTVVSILGGTDGGNDKNTQATISARVKQQNAMASAPVVNLTMNNTAEIITKADIVAVTTQNDGSATVVQLWGRITNNYEAWNYTPLLNAGWIGGANDAPWIWSPLSAFQASLPTGTQTAAIYGDSFANTLTVQTATNTSTAFQVQNSSGTDVLNVDTTNSYVGVGSSASSPSRTLDVSVNNSSTTALPLLVRQAGSGDSGIEVKNSSQNYYIGINAADANSFNINSAMSAGGGIVGMSEQGPTFDTGMGGAMSATKFTASKSGTITTLYAYIGTTGTSPVGEMAIYSDVGTSRPGSKLASSASTSLTGNSWNSFTISSTSVTAGTSYWLAYNTNDSSNNNLAVNWDLSNPSWYKAQTYNSWQSPTTTGSAFTGAYSMYGTITSTITDVFSTSLFRLSQTGAVTIQNSVDSSSAFQVLDTSSNQIFSVDTSAGAVHVKGSGGANANGRIYFGDGTFASIGEYTEYDTDALGLYGSAGINLGTSGNTSAFTINSSGQVGVATTSPSEAMTVNGNLNVRNADTPTKQYRFRTSGGSLDMEGGGASLYLSTWTSATFASGQVTHIIMYTSGQMAFQSIPTITASIRAVCIDATTRYVQMGTGTSCSTSSIRFKKNVQDLPAAMGLDAIKAMRPVTFEYNNGSDQREKIGFIAEEMQSIMPDVVDYDDQGLPTGIDYQFLTANIVKAIQQQQVQIDNLRQGLWDGGIVSNDTTFNSLVTFNGGVDFKGPATFEGKVNFMGKVTYNPDAGGTIVIPKGQTTATVTFNQPYDQVPQVTVSASDFVGLKITDKSANGFTITMHYPSTKDISIDWVATQVALASTAVPSNAPTVVTSGP